MMSMAHLYPDFSGFIPGAFGPVKQTDDLSQDEQLKGFETGYQAGWEDAAKAINQESDRLTSDFVQSVQDMSFTYREAYAKLSAGMQPLMSRFVTTLLPVAAKDALSLHLVDQIHGLLNTQSENIVELVVSPDRAATVEDVLSNHVGIPFKVSQEPSLSVGQAFLRVNQHERELDLDAVVHQITEAIDAFFHTAEKEMKHG